MKDHISKRIESQLRMQSRLLKKNSDSNYRRLLLELCSHYDHFDFVQKFKKFTLLGDWASLLDHADSLSAQQYSDATMHLVANQFAALVRKYPFDPRSVSTDPEKKAYETFLKSERKCSRLNLKFKLLDKRSPYEHHLSRMRSFIRYVIGGEPNIEEVMSHCSFGAGASVGVHGNATHLGRKISGKWTVTPGAFMIGFDAIMSHHQLSHFLCEKRNGYYCFDKDKAFLQYLSRTPIVTYNKISFVPKTARTHRTIAVEPVVNGYLQKGIDVYLRARLKRININLSDQTRNQDMARIGSCDDSEESFVTIDLSSASDSISIGLVRNLLPEDWFYLLDRTRSPSYMMNGKLSTYHKFCSMGNGFCFPLETLIFVAACFACGCGKPGTDFSVYGDDIIVRKSRSSELVWLLSKLGFSTNKGKTFLQGPFRESCGADWFGGRSVRPFTLDFKLDSVESIFKFLNITKERSSTEHIFKDSRVFLFSLLSPSTRLVRPFKGNHDSGIDGYIDEFLSSPNCYLRKRFQCWAWYELRHFPVADMQPLSAGVDDESIWMYSLLFGASSSHSRRLPVDFYLRRKTRTNVVRQGYAGATSMWLPPLPK